MEYARARLNMVNNQLRPNRVDDPKVLDAMATRAARAIPARRCAAWPTPTRICRCRRRLADRAHVLARLIQAAEVRPTDVVLVVGCTTGYAGAVLARLAGTVILVEPPVAARP